MIHKCLLLGTSSVFKNEQCLDSLFAPPHCPADHRCLWNRRCHPGLEHQSRPHAAPRVHTQQYGHQNHAGPPPSLTVFLVVFCVTFFLLFSSHRGLVRFVESTAAA